MQAHKRHGNIQATLDKSQFNRRLHRLEPLLFELVGLFSTLAKAANTSYALDSFPLPVCRNIRIRRCRLVQGRHHHGYCASKQEYYYGFKVHLITAADGRLIEFEFSPASVDDKAAFGLLAFQLPPQAQVFADKAYNVYVQEERLVEDGQIQFSPIRKANAKKADNTYVSNWLRKHYRRHIESDISRLENLFPKKIHAVTKNGFLLKILGFFLANHFLFFL